MRDVAVVGVNMLKFGRYPDKDVVQLAAESAIAAMKDAGCTIKDIEIMVSGNLYQSNATVGQRVTKRSKYGPTAATVVCCSMISLSQT